MGGTTRGHSGNDPRHTSGRKDLGGHPSTGAVPYSDSGFSPVCYQINALFSEPYLNHGGRNQLIINQYYSLHREVRRFKPESLAACPKTDWPVACSARRSQSRIWSLDRSFQLFEIFFNEALRTSCVPVATPVGQHLTKRMLRPPTWRAVTPFADPENPPKAKEGSAIIV